VNISTDPKNGKRCGGSLEQKLVVTPSVQSEIINRGGQSNANAQQDKSAPSG
jgi:hypothetical protein